MATPWYLGFAPWVVFAIAMRGGGQSLAWGSVAALLTALVVLAVAVRAGRVTVLEVGAPVVYVGILVAALLASGSEVDSITGWSRTVSAAALAVIVLATARTHPFTRVHLEQLVPPQRVGTPGFAHLCTALARLTGAIAVVIAASCAVAELIDTAEAHTVFNWLFPLVLIATSTWVVHQRVVLALEEDEEEYTQHRDLELLTLELGTTSPPGLADR